MDGTDNSGRITSFSCLAPLNALAAIKNGMILPPDDGLLRRRLAAPQNDPFLCFFPEVGDAFGGPKQMDLYPLVIKHSYAKVPIYR